MSYEYPDRIYLFKEDLNGKNQDKYGKEDPAELNDQYIEVDGPPEANLISSKCKDGMHAPVLDFDFPIEVYPSSQLGHNHLYINKKVDWESYCKIMVALQAANLIETGYCDASINKGFSAVRPVGVVKPTAPKGVDVLIENAKLRQENYKLRQEREYLLQLVNDYTVKDYAK